MREDMDGRMSTKVDPGVLGRDYWEGITTMVKQLGRRRYRRCKEVPV